MGLDFRTTKTAKVVNKIRTQNIRGMKATIKSQHIYFSGGTEKFCFTSFNNHVVRGKSILRRVDIWLQKKAVIDKVI
jgi:hypothetical protein